MATTSASTTTAAAATTAASTTAAAAATTAASTTAAATTTATAAASCSAGTATTSATATFRTATATATTTLGTTTPAAETITHGLNHGHSLLLVELTITIGVVLGHHGFAVEVPPTARPLLTCTTSCDLLEQFVTQQGTQSREGLFIDLAPRLFSLTDRIVLFAVGAASPWHFSTDPAFDELDFARCLMFPNGQQVACDQRRLLAIVGRLERIHRHQQFLRHLILRTHLLDCTGEP